MLGPPADYRPISKHDRANQQVGGLPDESSACRMRNCKV